MSGTGSFDLSPLEYHLLLALADGEKHGYALRHAIEEESRGAIDPKAGTLYRVLARLLSAGMIRETDGPVDAGPHPGRPRRYYGLSPRGREALVEEAARMRNAALLAERRLGPIRG